MSFSLALVLASIAAVALGLAVQRLVRAAATRHAVLLAALLLPPVLAAAAFAGLRLPATAVVTTGVIVAAAEPTAAVALSHDARVPMLVLALWLAGFAISLVRIAIHLLRWRGVAARAELVNGRIRSVEVLEPTVIGIVHPVIVLPAAYDFTPAELDAVFAHERAHIARRDNLTALAVQLVCAAFWFDPLHHLARRKLVELRERAVDDLVLEHGCDAEAYVSALARSCEPSFQTPVACMSRLNLQERMESIMTHESRRRWPASIRRIVVAVAVAAAAIAFATFAPAPSLVARDAAGSVYDFNVRAMPHADGRYTLSVRIDAPEGGFSSVAVVPSAPDQRTVSTTHGGKKYEVAVDLAADGTAVATLTVAQGETIVATKRKSFARETQAPPVPPPPPLANDPNMVRPRPIVQIEPVYPEEAKQRRIAGVVITEVSLDEQGSVTDVRVVKPLPHGLSEAAVEAIRQWKFEPATRDGKPVATTFHITINFRPD